MIVCSKCGEKHMRSECDKDSEVTRRNEREHDRIWNAAIDAAIALANKMAYVTAEELKALKKEKGE